MATLVQHVTREEDMRWAWRIPFLSGIIVAAVGITMRANQPHGRGVKGGHRRGGTKGGSSHGSFGVVRHRRPPTTDRQLAFPLQAAAAS